MDLKEFISKTVADVIEGIGDASERLKDKNKKVGLYSTGKNNQRHIEFDVAVVVSNKGSNKKSGNGAIEVWSVARLGGKIEKTSETLNSTVSRIKFGIRIKDAKRK